MFLGIYDYTVYLTYLNLLSGFIGVSLVVFIEKKIGLASVFLLISGICDIFDGIVSRSKKNRSLLEKRYGVQIDSLADLVSFGVLPVAIGYSLLKQAVPSESTFYKPLTFAFIFFGSLYVLAALIRLAYFNVLTEENKELNSKVFIGVPVTFSSVLFPFLILIYLQLGKLWKDFKDIQWCLSPLIYLFFLMLFSFLFVYDKIKFKKQKNILYFFLSALFLTLILILLYLEMCLKK
ncbi:CDP-alcohol phosphatidyltransferase family protein [Vaccinium witches'-broom phytoplasma]|uniref:CDP-alcohol phosphatidyltransferase family protein n=1 Tax=Vaccinium witches'-broom phytoplasma TaxID=85642 RepID=UPI00037E8D00|nr:CDP-alcohol phosphatidyltransferase family protein [Vaccinium witches'-broom phytoplasma]